MTASEPTAIFIPPGGFDGVVDMADNSFDGNKDLRAQGPETPTAPGVGSGLPPFDENAPDPANQGDDYRWDFNTNNTIDLTAPEIEDVWPNFGASGLLTTDRPYALFNKIILSSSVTQDVPPGSGSVRLEDSGGALFYDFDLHNLPSNKTKVTVKHSPFAPSSNIALNFNSKIKDIYQNCYAPSGGMGCFPSPPAQPYCCDGALQATPCTP